MARRLSPTSAAKAQAFRTFTLPIDLLYVGNSRDNFRS
jgi:hypothetical protein